MSWKRVLNYHDAKLSELLFISGIREIEIFFQRNLPMFLDFNRIDNLKISMLVLVSRKMVQMRFSKYKINTENKIYKIRSWSNISFIAILNLL